MLIRWVHVFCVPLYVGSFRPLSIRIKVDHVPVLIGAHKLGPNDHTQLVLTVIQVPIHNGTLQNDTLHSGTLQRGTALQDGT